MLVTFVGTVLSSVSLLVVLRTTCNGQSFTLKEQKNNEVISISNRVVIASVLLVVSWSVSFILSVSWSSSFVDSTDEKRILPSQPPESNEYKMFEVLYGRPPTYGQH